MLGKPQKKKIRKAFKEIKYYKEICLISPIGCINCLCEFSELSSGRYSINKVSCTDKYDVEFVRTKGNYSIFNKNKAIVRTEMFEFYADVIDRKKLKSEYYCIIDSIYHSHILYEFEKIINQRVIKERSNNDINNDSNIGIYEGVIGFLILCDFGDNETTRQYKNDYKKIEQTMGDSIDIIVPGFSEGSVDVKIVDDYISYLQKFGKWKWKKRSTLLIVRYIVEVDNIVNGDENKKIILDFSTYVEYVLDDLLREKKIESVYELLSKVNDVVNKKDSVREIISKLVLQKLKNDWYLELNKLLKIIKEIK